MGNNKSDSINNGLAAASINKDLEQELERLKAENESLRKSKASGGSFSLKVSEKGAVSIYGMGRFPVTLYREQWEKLNARMSEVMTFIQAHASELSSKADKAALKVQPSGPTAISA